MTVLSLQWVSPYLERRPTPWALIFSVLDKKSSAWGFETPLCSCDAIIMIAHDGNIIFKREIEMEWYSFHELPGTMTLHGNPRNLSTNMRFFAYEGVDGHFAACPNKDTVVLCDMIVPHYDIMAWKALRIIILFRAESTGDEWILIIKGQ